MNKLIQMKQFCAYSKAAINVSTGFHLFQKPISFIALIIGISCAAVPFTALSQGDKPTTWEEFDREATALVESVSFLAAEISDGACEEIHGIAPDRTLAIGSGFKLYILGELAQQIAHHTIDSPSSDMSLTRLKWGSPLDIQQHYKSVPHGPLLYVPYDSTFTIRYFAEQMIQRSDNTATDHLLFLLGRQNVERRMAEMGHHNPALNTPLFSTREFAIAKFLWTDEEWETYLSASNAERRMMLAKEQRGYEALEAHFEEHEDPVSPTRIDSVEWFANRFDMCKALMSLHDMAQHPQLRPVTEILTLEDQIGINREDWTYVGFKGGSEIGVLAGNWLLQRNDGRLFVMTMAFNDTAEAIDLPRAIELLQGAVDILFQTP